MVLPRIVAESGVERHPEREECRGAAAVAVGDETALVGRGGVDGGTEFLGTQGRQITLQNNDIRGQIGNRPFGMGDGVVERVAVPRWGGVDDDARTQAPCAGRHPLVGVTTVIVVTAGTAVAAVTVSVSIASTNASRVGGSNAEARRVLAPVSRLTAMISPSAVGGLTAGSAGPVVRGRTWLSSCQQHTHAVATRVCPAGSRVPPARVISASAEEGRWSATTAR